MSVRITTLLGAGSTLDLVRRDGVITPTSGKILDSILELKSQTLDLGMYPVLKEIHDKVVEVLRTVGNKEFKMIFHVDIIKFYSMLEVIKENQDYITELYEIIGFIDSSVAIASYRESLNSWSVPQLYKSNDIDIKIKISR